MSETTTKVEHTPGPWISEGPFIYALTPLADSRADVNRFSTNLQRGYNCTHAELEANARLIAAAPDLLQELRQEAELLDRFAARCDAWADESERGGWSTHQVKANRAMADECRRRAAGIRETIARATGEH